MELIELYDRTLAMKELGAVPYGGDLFKYPAKLVDAFVILQGEEQKVRNLSLSTDTPKKLNKQKRGKG